ncbi:hypothetical protein BU16DRAFT_542408 [Lophium mytilinum]|uniref:MARVEL domain-containing protein n=1 Tax=Lophium mytilinum TaxID=390894 RepID=A0A6A6QKM4_9PEZI|nr:hypothetical protein BU16DRAFT_542408 [Lophium mytilinum]
MAFPNIAFGLRQASLAVQAQLPYQTHPIYQLRRASICVAIIGCTLTLLTSTSDDYHSNEQPIYGSALILLFISFLFCCYDLATYAIAKITPAPVQQPSLLPSTCTKAQHSNDGGDDDDPEPQWPRKSFLIADGILPVLLHAMFWFIMASESYYSTATGASAGLASLVASALHGIAFYYGYTAWKHIIELEATAYRKYRFLNLDLKNKEIV